MSSAESSHSGSRGGSSEDEPGNKEPSLEDLIGRIRLELTGGAREMPSAESGPVADVPSEQARQAARSSGNELSIEDVMARMRLELRRRRGESTDDSAATSKAVIAGSSLPRWRPSATPLAPQPPYVLADLLRFSDGDFVDHAFRVLLRRPAGLEERAHYLDALRRGGIGKVEILGDIRFSDEGMQHGVHVDGLLLPYKLHKWRRVPAFGWFLATAIAIFRLPRLFAHLQKMEAESARESQQVGLGLNDLADAIDIHLGQMQVEIESRAAREDMRALAAASSGTKDLLAAQALRLAEIAQTEHETRGALELIEGKLAEQMDAQARLEHRIQARVSEEVSTLALATGPLRERLADQTAALAQIELAGNFMQQAIGAMQTRLDEVAQLEAELKARLESGLADRATAHAQLEQRVQTQSPLVTRVAGDSAENRRAVRDIERRLMAFFDYTSRQTIDAPRSGPGIPEESTGLLDAHYVSFEDTFRGTRDDIKARAAHYLEAFSDAGIGKDKGLVLDLGCGRGEWLEVLTENGYTSRGVDLNSVMVSEAVALGLDAVKCDAVAYLRSLGNESLSAITSMHLVEHIPYEVLITLLDEALRILQPGGVLILETPNPENLTVGSFWFYMDPTHRNPIPPTLLQWVVQARGFGQAAIDRLTQNRGVFDIQPVDENVAGSSQINKIVGLLTAAPDYAIVARKPDLSSAQAQESFPV